MDEIARESLLYDFYGGLLTDKKRAVMECYHEDDMSLGEIAEDMGISRAAVHDSLKSAEAQLEQYEEKLGLVERFRQASMLASEAESIISELEIKASFAEDDHPAAGGDKEKEIRNSMPGARGSRGRLKRLREIIASLAEPGS